MANTTQQDVSRRGLWRDMCPRLAVLAGVLLAVGLFPAGCSSGKNMIDDNNPFYLHGLRLRQENKYEEAAVAFEKCLRFSPSSSKAELQLAMLYEDRLNDPVKAIEHYQAYLLKVPQGENSDTVRKWLARVERTFLQQLMDRYPEDVDILMGRNLSPEQNANWTPRERALYQQVKRLNGEIMALRQASAKAGADPRPGAGTSSPLPAGGVPGPRTPANTPPPLELPQSAVETPGAPAIRHLDAPPVTPPAAGGMTAGAGAAGTGPGPVEPPTRDFVPVRRLTQSTAPLTGAVGAGAAAGIPAGAPAMTTASSGKTYTVLPGDTLSSISRKMYGSVKFWGILRDANRDTLRGGTQVRVGTQLRVPPKPPT